MHFLTREFNRIRVLSRMCTDSTPPDVRHYNNLDFQMKTEIGNLINKLADKSLTFGCRAKDPDVGHLLVVTALYDDQVYFFDLANATFGQEPYEIFTSSDYKIYGHPVCLHNMRHQNLRLYF